jgi:hypothetical protein
VDLDGLTPGDNSAKKQDGNPQEYTQKIDPPLKPFLGSKQNFIGQSAMEKQIQGKEPTAGDVRVTASKGPFQRAGAGLHEGLPTDQRGKIASEKSEVAAGIQSGMRSATDLTLLVDPSTGHATGHTGMFPKATGRGSTNTTGQAPAHDKLRFLSTGGSPAAQVSEHMGAFLGGIAHGQQVMDSPLITGGIPNVVGASPIGPEAKNNATPDPTRVLVAQRLHEPRENTKKRTSTFEQKNNLPRSSSPEREPLDKKGEGGYYVKDTSNKKLRRHSSPMPDFGDGPVHERVANQTAWLTAPFRHNSEAQSKTKKCPKCGADNYPQSHNCAECSEPLPDGKCTTGLC